MYLPKHFAARDRAAVEAFVDGAGAADLVTFDGTKPIASLIPVIWDRSGDTEHGRLLGHLALQNPQWRSVGPDTVALAIVHGPQAYVSPSWYPSTARHGKVVPTWNYVSVHFTGPLTVHRDAGWLREVVGQLTARHEAGRPSPWHDQRRAAGLHRRAVAGDRRGRADDRDRGGQGEAEPEPGRRRTGPARWRACATSRDRARPRSRT